MFQVQNLPLATRNLQLLRGYIAFNAGDRDTLGSLFCDDDEDHEGNVRFPLWHLMDGTGTIRGKELILDYLVDDLWANGTRADFLGVGSQGTSSITLDFTTDLPGEEDHVCADKIVFDESGCIKEVWHCSSATHAHGHAGHPLTADGQPHEHT
jgi:hypothetical protein